MHIISAFYIKPQPDAYTFKKFMPTSLKTPTWQADLPVTDLSRSDGLFSAQRGYRNLLWNKRNVCCRAARSETCSSLISGTVRSGTSIFKPFGCIFFFFLHSIENIPYVFSLILNKGP